MLDKPISKAEMWRLKSEGCRIHRKKIIFVISWQFKLKRLERKIMRNAFWAS
jgi:hypothetical protein